MARMMSLKALLLIYFLSALSHLTTSTDHMVGGQDDGWDIGIDLLSWTQGQQFNVGDTLTFKYQVYHDVLEVSKQNYETCTTTNAFSRYTGGSTTIELSSAGSRYFICGIPHHCSSGMKLEVNVVPSANPSPPPPSTIDSPPPPTASPPPPPPPTASPPPPPSPIYYSSPPPTPTPDYSSPAPPVVSDVPPPPSPTSYSSPPPTSTPDYSSPPSPVVSVPPPPSTTNPSQPPPSPQMPTPTYTTTPPTVAVPPTTTECDSPPKTFMAPAPTPKHHKPKKPHQKHGKAPRHAPAPAPNVYKLSKNYVSLEQGSELITSAAPAKHQLGNFGVSSVLTVLMLWLL